MEGEQKGHAESLSLFLLDPLNLSNNFRNDQIIFKMFSSFYILGFFFFLPETTLNFFEIGICDVFCPESDGLCREDNYGCPACKSRLSRK